MNSIRHRRKNYESNSSLSEPNIIFKNSEPIQNNKSF